MSLSYSIHRADVASPLDAGWNAPTWQRADEIEVSQFHSQSSRHRPVTRVRMLHGADGLFVRFFVEDSYVLCARRQYQDPVCHDSCVEFFVQPKPPGGYFNFEINCGGALHLRYIEDWTRRAHGFAQSQPVSEADADGIRIDHSMPKVVFPELAAFVRWQIGCFIPWRLFEAYVGPLAELSGQEWRGNFFKCADHSSHPHWASWSAIGDELNFHQPHYFAPLRFMN